MLKRIKAWGSGLGLIAVFLAVSAAVVAPVASSHLAAAALAAVGDTAKMTTAGQTSAIILARVQEQVNVVLSGSNASSTSIVLENRLGGGNAWRTIKTYSTASAVNDTITNDQGATLFLRLRAATIPALDTVSYQISTVVASRTIQEWLGNNGQSVFKITDLGVNTPRIDATSFIGTLTGNAVSSTRSVWADSATGSFRSTKLTTARTINGVSFDGTANITVSSTASTLGGTSLASNVVSSSLTSLGTLTSLTTSGLIDASGASAGQIAFPATQNASANANTLDDYAEGNWTPVVTFGGGNTGMTFNIQQGKYTKVGNRVDFALQIRFTALGSSTGVVAITLPFTAAATYITSGQMIPETAITFTAPLFIRTSPGTNTFGIYHNVGGAATQLTHTAFVSTSNFVVTGTFFTN